MMTKMLVCSFLMASVTGHGLIKSPKSRNQRCGVEVKPHMVVGQDNACAQAFEGDFNGGYQFMSVLTHTLGRAEKRSKHVCGYDSETWKGGPSPWDKSIDWPTTSMSAGRTEFVWDIQWGPHFDDTDDFKYYITKPDFKYTVGQELTWDDFEETPFCSLRYDDKKPTANPDVISDKDAVTFTTYCNVPERSGRHVIYGEWGRRESTFERFHGCVDATFGGSAPVSTSTPVVVPTPAPTVATQKPVPTPVPTVATQKPATPVPVAPTTKPVTSAPVAPTAKPVTSAPVPKPVTSAPVPKPVTPVPVPTDGEVCPKYSSCAHKHTCCEAGTKCYRQSQWYSQCLTSCPAGWDCNLPGMGYPDEDKKKTCERYSACTHDANCCVDGTKCFRQSQWYSQCLQECPQGHGWECSQN